MKVQFKINIGEVEYSLTEDVSSNTDFFKKIAFYTSLPKVGPNGETDLVLHYKNPKNFEYFSIVSKKAGMEYKFGQFRDNEGSLFPKKWEPLFEETSKESSHVQDASTHTNTSVPTPAVTGEVQEEANAILEKFGL